MSLRIGDEPKTDNTKVDEHRIGPNVVRTLGPVIELAGIKWTGGEETVVDDQITRDVTDTRVPESQQKFPETLRYQERVTAALEIQVAFQTTVSKGCGAESVGLPRCSLVPECPAPRR